jgi:hypothetical protein
MAWILRIVGVVLVLLGALWFLQGINVVPVGFMAGHIQYSILGVIAVLLGVGVFWFATWRRGGNSPVNRPGTRR